MRHIYLIFFCGIITILTSPVRSQVKFSATITPGKIGTQDYATLRYTISGSMDIEHIYPPEFKAVELVSGPNNELNEMDINGRATAIFSLSFVVRPLKAGKIKLPGARAKIAGKEYVSNPVTLHVLKIPSTAGTHLAPGSGTGEDMESVLHPGEDVNEKVKKNMVLKLETNKKEVFVGEPVLASFKLFSRLRSNTRLTLNPSFNGFSVIDLQAPDETEATTGKLNGQDFNVYTVRKALLYPLQPGTFTIDRLELENHIQFLQPGPPRDPYDLFSMLNGGYGNAITKVVSLDSDPADIVVKPLPEKNKPANFSGAVGNYKISTRLVQDKFSLNEEGRLVVEISGSGNLQLVNAPALQWPDGVEAFDPKVKDTLNTASFPVLGKKTFEFAFSANKPGSFIIPEVSFSYFDPEKREYLRSRSKPLSFSVSEAESKAPVETAMTPKDDGEQETYILWLILPAAAVAALVLFLVFRSLRKEQNDDRKSPTKTIEESQSEFHNPASALKGSSDLCHEGNSRDFYPVLNRELKGWFIKQFCLEANEVSMDRLRQCMDEKNIPNKIVLETQSLLREIEWQLYAPSGDRQKMHEHFARARMLIQDLNAPFKAG